MLAKTYCLKRRSDNAIRNRSSFVHRRLVTSPGSPLVFGSDFAHRRELSASGDTSHKGHTHVRLNEASTQAGEHDLPDARTAW